MLAQCQAIYFFIFTFYFIILAWLLQRAFLIDNIVGYHIASTMSSNLFFIISILFYNLGMVIAIYIIYKQNKNKFKKNLRKKQIQNKFKKNFSLSH